MTQPLKLCSGAVAVRKLKRDGWEVARQKGSHVMLIKAGYQYTLSVPQHKQLGVGILTKLLKQAGITPGEFDLL